MSLLTIKNLSVDFKTDQGTVKAVRGINLEVQQGEIVGIVGESGSGKSQTMYSLMGLLSDNGKANVDEMVFDDVNISLKDFSTYAKWEKAMENICGNTMSMIFQDTLSFLNQVLTITEKLIEPLKNHTKLNSKQLHDKAVELLTLVGIPSPEERLKQYPHELSGGMRQRVIIAIAIACQPKLIIADEPTTALDVTIQSKIIQLIKEMKDKLNSSVILITHDLGVVASCCDKVNIMYGGKIVENGTAEDIFYNPKHPYTIGLLACVNNPQKQEKLQPIPGSPPDLLNPPMGCPFVDRCDKAMKICKFHPPKKTAY